MDGTNAPSSLAIVQVDVFAEDYLTGNPAAVVFGADATDTALMQAIARETNLSETVFLFPPRHGGDVFMRTFTTRREIDFAVHPALAAAHAYCDRGMPVSTNSVALEYAKGTLHLWRDGPASPWFAKVPEPVFAETTLTGQKIAGALGLTAQDVAQTTPQIVATGVPWLLVEIVSRQAFERIIPDMTAISALTQNLTAVGVTVYHRDPAPGVSAVLRSFAPAEGIYEDPVCGSCAGALAALLRHRDPGFARTPVHRFAQGQALKRPGIVHIRLDDRGIHVGGVTLTTMRGYFDKEISRCPV